MQAAGHPLPHGFVRVERGAVTLVADAGQIEAIERLGLLAPGALARTFAQAGGPAGRARVAILPLGGSSGRLCLRFVRRGGWIGDWLPGVLTGLSRPLAELDVTARLRVAGAPVPRPLCVVAERRGARGASLAVGTAFVEGAVDALHFLETTPSRDRVLRAATAAGIAVRSFHDAGGCHADLHVKNLLLRENAEQLDAIVIDLDRARIVRAVSPRARLEELMRLYRSLVKRRLITRVGPRGCARFFAAYTDRDRALRRALRAGLPRERLRLALHALHYR
ncbi:MAG: hypothetical protein IT386_16050 [Deltaproteobacteria bacterium]|nr:hypothetical protein [Deltaproteobacteria bacterium]